MIPVVTQEFLTHAKVMSSQLISVCWCVQQVIIPTQTDIKPLLHYLKLTHVKNVM
jgi:hypothetical protein